MFNQKGQIHIIALVLLVVGFILYANFSGSSIGKWFKSFEIKPSSQTPSKSTVPSKSAPTEKIIPAPSEPDTAPPKRLNIQPKDKSNLPPETRQTTLSLDTNEKATCRYSDTAGVSYNSMQGKFSQTGSTSHSVLITALSEGGKYKFYIKCADEEGNKNTDDLAVSFEVKLPEDKTPPVLINPSHRGNVLPKGTKEAVISISTNEPASCRYSTEAEKSYSQMPGRFSYYDQTEKFHVKTITGLEGGKIYDFFVRCQDSAKNSNTGDVLINFSVAQ